ncbi:hypothetical protein [Faecalibacter sp. LW9]|uniref:hypothetical protein n=1 Tax=Faecalibacter sp. LW9 TaxID=3103144 RepID=UPI002B002BE0|nr:hypothetical protein [Faecalibacter sp. LW9]
MSTEKKQEILDVITHPELSNADKYNQLLREYQNHPKRNKNVLQNLNRTGFNTNSYNKLIYEVQKLYGISDVEIKTHVLPQENKGCTTCLPTSKVAENENKDEDKNPADTPKLRVDFPFLNQENTPDEFKILVADRITLYKQATEMRGIIEDPNTQEEVRAELAPKIAEADEKNDAIWKELNHYQETGEILGEHPIFSTLSLSRKIDLMTAAEKIQRVESLKNQIRTAKGQRTKAEKANEVDKVAELDGKIKNLELEIQLVTKSLEKANNE